MTWKEDQEIWNEIDDLILNAKAPIVRLCNLMSANYAAEMDEVGRGVLFGGLGAFCVAYTSGVNEGMTPHDAFGLGMAAVVNNGHFQNMMREQVVEQVDTQVERVLPLGGDGDVS